jgi:hypothetical protein
MKRLIVLLPVVLAACVTTSGTTTPAPAKTLPNAAEFYPLELGTVWTYEVKLLGESRNIEVTTLKKTSEGFVEDSTGAQFLTDSYGVRDQKRYLLRNPIETGTKWTNVVSVSSVENYEIIATSQPCDAPAGAWDGCVVVESRNRVEEGTVLVNEMTFAPRVGIVRLTTVLESNGKQIPQSSLALLKFSRASAQQ